MNRKELLAVMWEHLGGGGKLLNAKCEHIAIENPVMHLHAKERIRGYRASASSTQPLLSRYG
jgi:hypothetical protein